MHPLAVTPAIPRTTVSAPRATPPGSPNHNAAAYSAATDEKPENSRTSRLNHDRLHMRNARYA